MIIHEKRKRGTKAMNWLLRIAMLAVLLVFSLFSWHVANPDNVVQEKLIAPAEYVAPQHVTNIRFWWHNNADGYRIVVRTANGGSDLALFTDQNCNTWNCAVTLGIPNGISTVSLYSEDGIEYFNMLYLSSDGLCQRGMYLQLVW